VEDGESSDDEEGNAILFDLTGKNGGKMEQKRRSSERKTKFDAFPELPGKKTSTTEKKKSFASNHAKTVDVITGLDKDQKKAPMSEVVGDQSNDTSQAGLLNYSRMIDSDMQNKQISKSVVEAPTEPVQGKGKLLK
jgi:hypothetical protein